MRFSKILGPIIKRTHDPPRQFPHSIQTLVPTNRNSKTQVKMAQNQAPMAMEMEPKENHLAGRMPTRSSAHLAEKLKKLMETPQRNPDVMECKSEDVKKQSHATAKKVEVWTSVLQVQATDTSPPDTKCLQNGATPPPIAREHACHGRHSNEPTMESESYHKCTEMAMDAMETIEENEEVPEAMTATDKPKADPSTEANERNVMENQAQAKEHEKQDEEEDSTLEDKVLAEKEETDKPSAEEVAHEVISVSSDEEPEPVKQVDPKTWRNLHDEWLHSVMHAAIGNTMLKDILDLDNIEQVERPPPDNNWQMDFSWPIIQRYDLRLQVQEGDDQVNIFHQAFTKWFSKVQEADSTIVLYQWTEADRMEDLTLLIENITDVPTNLLLLRKFVHKLFLHTTGGELHVQVLMGSNENLATIMQMIGWWLKSTSQGMWTMDLQSAEETTCAGWLLFSAGDYDREALSREIWEFIGVQVAIRF